MREDNIEGDFATFTWPIEDRECTTTLEKIYEGRGKEIVPKRANFNSQILVNSHFHRITFGLDLKGTEQKCGHTVFKTQLSNIFVIIGKGNFMQKVEHERYVQNIKTIKLSFQIAMNHAKYTLGFYKYPKVLLAMF